MEPSRLRELLEATRDDAPDQGLSEVEALELREMLADDPELQAELTRIGQWDRALHSAADDVPIPVGLADRLRAAVAQELSPAVTLASESTAVTTDKPVLSRRRWLLAVPAIAAGLLVAIIAGAYLSQPGTIDVAQVQQETVALTNDLQSIVWQPADAAFPANAFPQQIRFKPVRWGYVASSLDRQAMVFDLVREGAPRAVVVAMLSPAASKQLPNLPKMQPGSDTGNVCVEVWQGNGYVYSLVVGGGKARYQYFLRDTSSLTANW